MKELFKKLIEVRDVSQQMHWNKSESGWNHESLQEFYTAVLESTDLLIEVYQGQFGLVDDFGEFESVDFSDKTKYFEDFATFVNSKRTEVVENATHLNAIIDDILISTYKLLYKLKHLK
tara:strand:+ start:11215 stop:11571 length:357 start_codon:yes stop_codon:yes gene_type:complete